MIDPKTIIDARRRMTASHPKFERHEEDAAEGGCGVVGLACEIPVAGRHLFKSPNRCATGAMARAAE